MDDFPKFSHNSTAPLITGPISSEGVAKHTKLLLIKMGASFFVQRESTAVSSTYITS